MFPTPSMNKSDLDQHWSNLNKNTQTFNNLGISGSNLRILEESISPKPQLQHSGRNDFPHNHFNIEGGKVFVAITQDKNDPNSYHGGSLKL